MTLEMKVRAHLTLMIMMGKSVCRKWIKVPIAIIYFSRLMRKPTICICENKGADQLRSNREADQPLCFCYTDSTIPLLPKYEISCFQPLSVLVQLGLSGLVGNHIVGFSMRWLIFSVNFPGPGTNQPSTCQYCC